MRSTLKTSFAVTAAFLAAAFASITLAQDYTPATPLRMVLPTGTGNTADSTGRFVADKFTKVLGWTTIVENKPGGSYIIGTQYMLSFPPDGHAVIMGNAAYSLLPFSVKNLPFDVQKDLAPIGRFVTLPQMLVAHPGVPAKTLPELIAYSKANPGKLSYGIAAV